jgi:hypothetical protein
LTSATRRRRGPIGPSVALLAIAGLACAIAACGGNDDARSLDLEIGDLIPLSGRLQEAGPSADKAAEIAVDQINEAIGAVGADDQVTLKTDDDQTSTAAGVAVAQKLVNRDATCITGSWSPAVTIAIARAVSIPEGILQISPATTRGDLASLDDHGLVWGIGSRVGEGDPAAEAFEELYASTEPTDIRLRTFDAQNFDAVVLCYLAAVAAGSTDGRTMAEHVREITSPPGRRYTWQQLPEAVSALSGGRDIDYEGASGPIGLSPKPGE